MSFSYKNKIAQWNWYDAEELSSTNDAIKQLDEENLPAVITAVRQNAGRGRRGRKWYGIDGNLYMTFSLKIELNELSRYVCLIALSIVQTILKYQSDVLVQIKWPNDIFFKHKKITGMLLENIHDNIWAVGIGVNIVGSPKLKGQLYKATSLQEQGIKVDRIDFLNSFLNQLHTTIQNYKNNGFENIKTEWLKYALFLNREIVIQNEKVTKKGTFLTLDENGYLVLKTDMGEERIIAGDLFVS